MCDKYQIVNGILEPPTLTLSTFLLNLRKLAAQSFTDSSTRKWFSKVLLEKNQKELPTRTTYIPKPLGTSEEQASSPNEHHLF